jgi:hypothetical protein
MKYIFGLIALCFCLSLSVDVGAVEQPVKTEFVQAQAPIVFCESIEVDFACVPTFIEATAIVPYSQPGESHGNLRRLCSSSLEAVTTNYLSLQIEAPFIERCRNCTAERMASAFAKEDFNITNSDWKVGWQAA